jgi:hypothetical protein
LPAVTEERSPQEFEFPQGAFGFKSHLRFRLAAERMGVSLLYTWLTAQGLVHTMRAAFPRLNRWFNDLPEPRCQSMGLDTAAQLWREILARLR